MVVCYLQFDVNAVFIDADAFFHGFDAFGLGVFLVDEIGEADFGDACVCLGDVSFDLLFWGCGFEGVVGAFDGLLYSFFIGFDGLDSVIYFC